MTAILRNNAGMTVVEVVVALGVIMVGLLALIAAMPLSTGLIGQSNLKTTAAFIAQQRLEQIKNAQWTASPAVDCLGGGGSDGTSVVSVAGCPNPGWPDEDYGTIVFPGAANCAQNDRSGGCRFRRQVRITDCSTAKATLASPLCSAIPTATGSVSNVRQVTVTVFFRPMSGTGTTSANEESLQLVTLIARRS